MNKYSVRVFENGKETEVEYFADYESAFEYMQARRDELEEEIRDYAEEITLHIELDRVEAYANLKAINDKD